MELILNIQAESGICEPEGMENGRIRGSIATLMHCSPFITTSCIAMGISYGATPDQIRKQSALSSNWADRKKFSREIPI